MEEGPADMGVFLSGHCAACCGRTSVCAGEGFRPLQTWAFEGLGSGRRLGSEV